MKECPTCRLRFADGNLRFCRYDGTPLVTRCERADEAVTILLSTAELRRIKRDQVNRDNTG